MENDGDEAVDLHDDFAFDGDADDEAVQAAKLLGVDVDASDREIRSALRARFRDTGLHPDHGGNAETARELIAAKNLLIERARAIAGGSDHRVDQA